MEAYLSTKMTPNKKHILKNVIKAYHESGIFIRLAICAKPGICEKINRSQVTAFGQLGIVPEPCGHGERKKIGITPPFSTAKVKTNGGVF
jgi:hypothetical protein